MTYEECCNALTEMQLKSLDLKEWASYLDKYEDDDLITMYLIALNGFSQTKPETTENYTISCHLVAISLVIVKRFGKINDFEFVDLQDENDIHGI